MKLFIYALCILCWLDTKGQLLDPIVVTTQSINIPGALAVGSWANEHPNQQYPNYPKMFFGFAEGDEIIIDFATGNKKGTQIIEVSEFESKTVVYSNNQFQTLDGVKIKVPKSTVPKFEFGTNHIFDRQAKVTIKRIPATEASKNFNCNVTWRTVNDTTFAVIEEKRKINSTYQTVTLQSPIDHFLNGGRNSRFQGGTSRITFPVTLPENTVEWYYSFAATRNQKDVQTTKSSMKLFGELSSLIDRSGILSIAVSVLTQPPGADYCHVYLLKPEHFEAFQNKVDDRWGYIPEGSRENLKSGVVKIQNCCKNKTYYIGIKNPDYGFGVSAMIEVVAIVEKMNFETVQVKKPVSVTTKKIPVFGS